MTGICVVAIVAAALQGCASSGEVATGKSGGTTTSTTAPPATAPSGTTSSAPATPSGTSAPASQTSSDTSSVDPNNPFGILTSDSQPSTTVQLPPATAPWTPQGELANAAPIDQVVNPDKSVTATYPKGAPAAHALTVKMRAARAGSKIVISLFIDNESGQQISMNEGLFTGGVVVDAAGNTLNAETFDSAWTLGAGSSDGNLHPGQPLTGDFVVDAPAAGSVVNAYWSQAISANGIMSGIILIRNIPIN